jgi:hypothetical protein
MTNEVTPESTDTGTVGEETLASDIESASDAEIEEVLRAAQEAEGGEAAEDAEVPTQEEVESSEEAQEDKPEKTEQQPAKAKSDEPVMLSREQWEALEAEKDKQRRQIEQQEAFIQRRNAEVGNLRKQLRERAEALDAQLADEDLQDNPVAVAKAAVAREKIEDSLKQLDGEEQQNTLFLESTRQLREELKPEDGIGVEHFVETLRRMKVPEQHLQEFQRNPVGWVGNPVAFRFLARTVKAEHMAKQLYQHAKAQESEIKKLRDKSSSVATDTATKISKALRSPPPMTAATPARTSQGRFTADPSKASDDEIEAFLQKAKR